MSKFDVDDKVIITNYDESNFINLLNGKIAKILKLGLDESYFVSTGDSKFQPVWVTDKEIMLVSKDNSLHIGDRVIVDNVKSSFHNLIGIIEDIKFQLDDSSYRYYVRFSDKDDCSFFFTVNEISIFNLSSLFSQTMIDILYN